MSQTADVDSAVYRTVHEFPKKRGLSHVESAAQAIGRSPGTTYNKADPGCETHQLTLREAVLLITGSGDFRILHSFAAACEHVALPLRNFKLVSDLELLDLMLTAAGKAGEKADAIRQALADGRIDAEELRAIQTRFHEFFTAEFELLSRLEALGNAKPKA